MMPISLGEMINIHRTRRKMSQSDLAKAVGISRNYVSMIERGNENVAYSVVLKICEVLGLEIHIGMAEGGRTQLAPDDAYASCPFRAFVNYPSLGDVVECEYRIAGKA